MKSLICILFCSFGLSICAQGDVGKLPYSTDNDSALYYLDLGWKQIMDEGRFSASEVSFRKAYALDSSFLIAKSLVARITADLRERVGLCEELQSELSLVNGEEWLVLNTFYRLAMLMNARDVGASDLSAIRNETILISEIQLGQVVHAYPNEPYLKSEYIEFIHANKGGQAALDSMDVLFPKSQENPPFITGYEATLRAELGQYEEALTLAQEFMNTSNDVTAPKPYLLLADVYYQMDSLGQARRYAEKAFKLDPLNLGAQRMMERVRN